MSKDNKNLTQCHACSGIVSKKAATCPHCGQKKPSRKPSTVAQYLLILVVLSCIVGVIISPANDKTSQSSGQDSGNEVIEEQAHKACVDAIRASVKNPSTLNIQYVMGYASKTKDNGEVLVVQSFSAKNGFGLEKAYDAHCRYGADGSLTMNTVEQTN